MVFNFSFTAFTPFDKGWICILNHLQEFIHIYAFMNRNGTKYPKAIFISLLLRGLSARSQSELFFTGCLEVLIFKCSIIENEKVNRCRYVKYVLKSSRNMIGYPIVLFISLKHFLMTDKTESLSSLKQHWKEPIS